MGFIDEKINLWICSTVYYQTNKEKLGK